MEVLTETIAQVLATVAVGLLGGKAFKFVHEGELGIRLRFGKAIRNQDGSPKIIQPGFVLIFPFVEVLKTRHVRQQTLALADQTIMIRGGLTFRVSAMVMFKVNDIYKALFEIEDLNASLTDISMATLRETLAFRSHTGLSDMKTMSRELLGELQTKSAEWGVEFLAFRLTDLSPTPETAPLINAEQGVKLKVAALKAGLVDFSGELKTLPPILAAALIGIPMVGSVGGETGQPKGAGSSSQSG